MQADRELLEKAAKAAGLKGYIEEWVDGPYFVVPSDPEVPRSEPRVYHWLTDDGDALRLAVKLDLTLRCYSGNTCAQTTTPGGPSVYVDETDHHDPYAATRRAIVRAAAALCDAKESSDEQ